jgi:hypothetical protein
MARTAMHTGSRSIGDVVPWQRPLSERKVMHKVRHIHHHVGKREARLSYRYVHVPWCTAHSHLSLETTPAAMRLLHMIRTYLESALSHP